MKNIGLVLFSMLLLMSCGSHKEDAAFEHFMNDLFIETIHIPIEEFDFEITEKTSTDYNTTQKNLFKLSELVCDFDREFLVGILMLGGDNVEVNGAVHSIEDSYNSLEEYSTQLVSVCKLDVDSALELYNSHRVKFGILVSTISEELDAIYKNSIFLRPYSFVEDTMLYENDYGCSRGAYIHMNAYLNEVETHLQELPELMKRSDVKHIGSAIRYHYSMREDDFKKVYSTWTLYDANVDSIVYVQEDELPMGLLIKMGLKSIF